MRERGSIKETKLTLASVLTAYEQQVLRDDVCVTRSRRSTLRGMGMCLHFWPTGMLTFFRADPYAASPKDCLYCTGLIPPSDSFIRPSLYQWM